MHSKTTSRERPRDRQRGLVLNTRPRSSADEVPTMQDRVTMVVATAFANPKLHAK